MKIENKELLLYSMNKSVDSVIAALSKEDSTEVFYRLGTAIHWLADCFDRVTKEKLDEKDIEKRLALHCVNNALKHCGDFVKMHQKEHGYDYPYDYPIKFEVFYVWEDMKNIKLKHENQKEAYRKLFKGMNIEVTLMDVRNRVNNIYAEMFDGVDKE